MGMIGNQLAPGTQFAVTNDSYNGDGSTTNYTLSQSVSATTDIEVIVDNVQQSPHDGSYSVSGTALTFSGAPSAGTNNIYVIYHGSKHHTTVQVIADDGSVDSSKIANLAVTHAKLHTDMDLSSKTVRIDAMNMGTGTDQWQLATQSAVSNRFALRSTHTTLGDGNPFIIYQPAGGGHQNDALVITADGYVTHSKLPSFKAWKNQNNWSLTAGNYFVWDSTNFNRGNCYDTSNGRFTAPVSGIYQFNYYSIYTGNAGNDWISFRQNGSRIRGGDQHFSTPSGSQWDTIGGSITINLTAGDWVGVYVGTDHTFHGSWWSGFSGFLVG